MSHNLFTLSAVKDPRLALQETAIASVTDTLDDLNRDLKQISFKGSVTLTKDRSAANTSIRYIVLEPGQDEAPYNPVTLGSFRVNEQHEIQRPSSLRFDVHCGGTDGGYRSRFFDDVGPEFLAAFAESVQNSFPPELRSKLIKLYTELEGEKPQALRAEGLVRTL